MATMIGGAILDIGGNALLAESAEGHKSEYKKLMESLGRPDVSKLEGDYFNDLDKYFPRADKLSQQLRSNEMTQNLALREQALPGIGKATSDALASINPLLRGELPQGVLDAFARAGGANSVGSGFGGSDYGWLNTGLFGARGSLGAIQTGMGLLPTLLQTLPNVSSPTTMGLLNNLMSPEQRVNLEMQLRQQQIGINTTIATMPTREDVWGQGMKQAGAMLMGGGMGGMGGGYSAPPAIGGGAGSGFMGGGAATGSGSNMGAASQQLGQSGGSSNLWGSGAGSSSGYGGAGAAMDLSGFKNLYGY